jgi:hypothetical protein
MMFHESLNNVVVASFTSVVLGVFHTMTMMMMMMIYIMPVCVGVCVCG